MSRLDFAPKAKEMEVTDITTGHFVFSPKPGKPVSYQKLDKSIRGAGYEIEKAWIEVSGKLVRAEGKLQLQLPETQQVFDLTGDVEKLSSGAEQLVTASGEWNETDGRQTILLELSTNEQKTAQGIRK